MLKKLTGIDGDVRSAVHDTVLDVVDVLLQPSLAVKVLVCVREQLLLVTAPSTAETVGVLQASVAVAVPNAAFKSEAEGLQPNVNVVPPAVRVGGVTSAVHLTVLDVVDVFRQPSVAVKVLVLERLHPSLTIDPSDDVIVTAPQTSVAVAVPSEPSGLAGLQPRFTSA